MKKVLMLTYYWPPSPGAGAQRLFSFARYLPDFGFKPHVLTPPTGATSTGLTIGAHTMVNGWDPTRRSNTPSRNTGSVKAPTANKIAEFIRLNVFIPDTKIGWLRPAYRKACEIIENEKPDIIFTSAPPYTVHLVGRALNKRYGIPWVADFRDPWLENHTYNTAHRMALPLWINRKMEQSVLQTATHITTALDSQRELLASKVDRSRDAFTTINNGFEHSAWDHVKRLQPTDSLYLSHFGTIYQEGLDLDLLTAIISQVHSDVPPHVKITLRLFGNVPKRIKDVLQDQLPPSHLELSPPVQHDDIEKMLQQQQLLLLIVNHGATHAYSHPSKVFEYMASGNPILAIGPPDHEVMQILRQHAADRSHICKDANQVRTAVQTVMEQWQQGSMPTKPMAQGPFSRKALTKKLADVFCKGGTVPL